jgi:hypothetical protein
MIRRMLVDQGEHEAGDSQTSASPTPELGWWRKPRFVCLLLSLFCAARMDATSIVIIHTEMGFVIAADSGLSDNSGQPLLLLACKVFSVKDSVAFGYGGLMSSEEFSPEALLRKGVDADLENSGRKVREALIPALTEAAKRIRASSPERFRFLLSGNNIFQLFLAVPNRVLLQGYSISLGRDGTVTVDLDGTIDCVTGTDNCRPGKIMRIGLDDVIVNYINRHSTDTKQFTSYADFAKFLVGLEITAHPKTTRPPIDVLEISAAGILWLQRKSGCK